MKVAPSGLQAEVLVSVTPRSLTISNFVVAEAPIGQPSAVQSVKRTGSNEANLACPNVGVSTITAADVEPIPPAVWVVANRRVRPRR